jgi:hypothetical protein
MKLGTYEYNMAPEPTSTGYFINALHQSVAGQRLGKNVTAAMNRHANTELLDVSFYMRSVSYQRRVCGSCCVPFFFSLLDNGSINTSRGSEEMCGASFSIRPVSYQRKVCD